MTRYSTPGPERQWVRVFKALRAGLRTSRAIAEAIDMAPHKVSGHLHNMACARLVERVSTVRTGRAGRPQVTWRIAA